MKILFLLTRLLGELIITEEVMTEVSRMEPDDWSEYPSMDEFQKACKERDVKRLYAWSCYLPTADTPEKETIIKLITELVIEATKRGEE